MNKKYIIGVTIIFIFLIVLYINFTISSRIQYLKLETSKEFFYLKIKNALNKYPDIQFYHPYRGKFFNSVTRIIYDSISFNYYGGMLFKIGNINSKERNSSLNSANFKQRLVSKVDFFKALGVTAMIQSDSFIRIKTLYYDRSDEVDNHFNKTIANEKNDQKKKTIGFVFFQKKPTSDLLRTMQNNNRYLIPLDSLNYYYIDDVDLIER